MDANDLGFVSGVKVPFKFKPPTFEKYNGTSCRITHATAYFRKAAKSTYSQAWEREMRAMRMISGEAYLHMMKTPPRYWSRLYFRTTNNCDVVLNNMSQAFNNVIVEARAKPLVTMLEEIRTYMMERWVKNRMRFQDISGNDILSNIKKNGHNKCLHKLMTCQVWSNNF